MNNDLEQFSEERLQRYINQFAEDGMCDITDDEIMPLIRIALAAKQAKPVAWVSEYQLAMYRQSEDGYLVCQKINVFNDGLQVYTTPQPAHTEQDGWIKCSERMPEDLDKNYQVVALSVKNTTKEITSENQKDDISRLGYPIASAQFHPLDATYRRPKPESE